MDSSDQKTRPLRKCGGAGARAHLGASVAGQAHALISMLRSVLHAGELLPTDVGVITPYSAQAPCPLPPA